MTTKKTKEQPFLSIGWKDAVKGFIVATLTALLTAVYHGIAQGGDWFTPINLKSSGIMALSAGIGYLLKNWLTNSDDKFMKSETKN